MKKNTMLTLEKNVIETAKALGINLSQVAGEALKKRLEERLRPRGQGIVQIPKTEKVILKNIGPFQGEKEFEFSDGMNVIVGANGSGKTTIIESIRAVYGDQRPPTKNEFVEDDEDAWIKVVPMDGEIKRDISEVGHRLTEGDFTHRIDFERFDSLTEVIKERMSHNAGMDFRGLSEGDRVFREIVFQSMATRPNECYVNDGALARLDVKIKEIVLDMLRQQDIQVILTFPSIDREDERIYSEDHNMVEIGERRS